jgi:hypothetical protein
VEGGRGRDALGMVHCAGNIFDGRALRSLAHTAGIFAQICDPRRRRVLARLRRCGEGESERLRESRRVGTWKRWARVRFMMRMRMNATPDDATHLRPRRLACPLKNTFTVLVLAQSATR